MKIALLSLYLPGSSKIGVGYQVHYLANEMVRRGHDVTVFSQSESGEGADYKLIRVPSGKHLRTFGFAWNLRNYDFSQFDALHACGDDWFLWGKKRPNHVHTYMGSLLQETLHAKGFTTKLRLGVMAVCEYSSCFLTRRRVAISQDTRRYIPLAKTIIPCGVDLSAFSPGAISEKSEFPSILFVGTMAGRKRGAMLLELFEKEIRPQIPNCRLWAVCEEKIESEGVEWMGRIPLEQLTDLYRRAWVFCLPSTYEGFGVPYIEAMASGTPVVAFPNPGAREVTQNGASGLLAEDDQLASELMRVLRDENLRADLRKKGLQRAEDFGWDTVCAQYETLYRGEKLPVQNSI